MGYGRIRQALSAGQTVLLDGATGTELERRGASMDPEAWCGPAVLDHFDTLKEVHKAYIDAGADIITANTYASSRLMLKGAGYADRVAEINSRAITAALEARRESGAEDRVAVAGSLSHMFPMTPEQAFADPDRVPSPAEVSAAFTELAGLLKDGGCDMILLEMMYHPDRMDAAFSAATETGLPVWAGFSARAGANGEVLSFTAETDLPFQEVAAILTGYAVDAAGIMHTSSNVVGPALDIIRGVYDGPLTAYPDSGYFKMPSWQFEDIISPADLRIYAEGWVAQGAQALGGCCGLSPEHIRALAPLKTAA